MPSLSSPNHGAQPQHLLCPSWLVPLSPGKGEAWLLSKVTPAPTAPQVHPALTFSLSMASSLPGANKMRSCRLDTEAARLDRAESEDEGLMPTSALVTVERGSGAGLRMASIRLRLLFSRSDESEAGEVDRQAGGREKRDTVGNRTGVGPREGRKRKPRSAAARQGRDKRMQSLAISHAHVPRPSAPQELHSALLSWGSASASQSKCARPLTAGNQGPRAQHAPGLCSAAPQTLPPFPLSLSFGAGLHQPSSPNKQTSPETMWKRRGAEGPRGHALSSTAQDSQPGSLGWCQEGCPALSRRSRHRAAASTGQQWVPGRPRGLSPMPRETQS